MPRRVRALPAFIGIHTGGAWLAARLHAELGLSSPLGFLSITLLSSIQRDLRAAGWPEEAPILEVHNASWPGEEKILQMAHNAAGLITATIASAILTNATTSEQYISILLRASAFSL